MIVCLAIVTMAYSVPAQPPAPQTVDTIADMLKAAPQADATPFEVRGYRQPDDGGGGRFLYERLGTQPADGGTVFEAEGVPGRFVRQFDAQSEALAEWFGAYGDGDSANPHDDQAAINACLASLGRVKLLAKTYGVRGKPTHYDPKATYNAIDLGPRYRIEGTGRDKTTIRLLTDTNPCGTGPAENYFNVLGNRAFHESADHAVVRDLTIDCNFDGQDKHTTINAIGVRGGGVLVERCHFRGYGTGRHPEGSSREAFVIHQTLVYKDPNGCREAATYRDLLFTDPGHNPTLEAPLGEITHITLGGANNFSDLSWILPQGKDPDFDPAHGGENENNWWPSYGGLVENCVIRDEPYTPGVQSCFLHGITYGDCIGLTIRSNRIENFEGVAVYVMSWWNRDTTIVDNEFLNVTMGLSLEAKGDNDVPLQMPSHTNVLFARNKITLAHPIHDPWSPRGVNFYGQTPGGDVRLDNVIVRDNTIEGTAYTNAKGQRTYPIGINIQILHARYRHLVFENNRINIPDAAADTWVPNEPYALSLTYYPLARWEEDMRTGNVIYRNNTNPEGQELYPILADWYYKNPPTWGKP
jgi:hypothetical protein